MRGRLRGVMIDPSVLPASSASDGSLGCLVPILAGGERDMTRTAVGYFRDRSTADAAYDDLLKNGFNRDDISIMGRGREGGKGLADHDHDEVGVGQGAAVGPLAAGLAGAITGGVTGVIVGGIVGALEDAGVDRDTAQYYDERFKQGGYLLTVRTNDMEYDKARMILQRHD